MINFLVENTFLPSDSVKKIAKNVPKTNKISEADFAILDLLIRKKPNASINALDALIMWSQNKTMKWLDTLSSGEKTTYLEQARKKAQWLRSSKLGKNN